ncbi:MAG: DNA recombination protein RmuC [Candidatus Omnitrophica bacterium]|nr:DNA recombination protein RmuC [Candidatus Omnitrophota bacterium]
MAGPLIFFLCFAAGAAIGFLLQAVRVVRLRERVAQGEALLAAERGLTQKLQNEFRLAASEELRAAGEQFLSAAIKDLRQVKTEADESLHLKNQEISLSFSQIRSKIEEYQARVRNFEDERGALYAKLESALKQVLEAEQAVRSETVGLKRALTTGSGVRGKLGERALLDILEQNELTAGIHFDTQVTLGTGDGADVRPDFVVKLPGDKHLVIDSKEVTGEYVLAEECEDEERRREHYRKLVQNIRENFMRLSRKEYQSFVDSDVPYVVMFIPSEAAIRAAFATDPGLFEEAYRRKVIMASPMTILPLIHLVKYSWRQQGITKNAVELGAVVGELGDRLCHFMGYLKNVRDGIQKSADSWDKAVGSWDRRVSPQLERVKDLGGRLKEPEELEAIRADLRQIEAGGPKKPPKILVEE